MKMRARHLGFAATAAVTVLAICGCGTSSNSRSDANPQRPSSPPVSSTSSGPPSVHRAAEQDTFHIRAAAWPTDLGSAAALYKHLPATFNTWRAQHPRFAHGTTGVVYDGPRGTGAIAWSLKAGKHVPDARAALAATFGMGRGCDKSTYRGSATPDRGGRGPGYGIGEDIDPWWFACHLTDRAHNFAVGWTSGDLAWLVVTPDEHTSGELVKTLAART
jgi:hypothetical protein